MPLVVEDTAARVGGVGSIAAAVRGAACGAFVVLVVSVSGCGAGRNKPSAPTGHSSAFAVLRTAPTSADMIPPRFARYLFNGDDPSLSHVDIQDARRVIPSRQVWLVPAPEETLCLVQVIYPLMLGVHGEHLPPGVGGKCSSEMEAEEGRLMATRSLSTRPAEQVPTRVYGIVPDRVRYVVARSSRNLLRTVTVQRNAYEFVMVNPSSVSFTTRQSGGRQRYVIPTPSVAGAEPYPSVRHPG
jgi:hypothetical protein